MADLQLRTCVCCPCPEQAKDSARIRDKVLEHMPHALVVGTGGPPAKQLHEDLEKIVQYTIDQ